MAFLVFFTMAAFVVVIVAVFVIKHNRDIKFIRQHEDERKERERLADNIRRLEIACGLINEPHWLIKKRYLG